MKEETNITNKKNETNISIENALEDLEDNKLKALDWEEDLIRFVAIETITTYIIIIINWNYRF